MNALLQFGSVCGLIALSIFVYKWLGTPKKVASDQDVTGRIPVSALPPRKGRFYTQMSSNRKFIGIALFVVAALLFIYRDRLPIVGPHFAKAKTSRVIARTVVAVDPCSLCQPDEKTIDVDDVLDDGRIRWKWSGPCTGGEKCNKCQVRPKSCTTDNDTDYALKCACSQQ